MAVDPDGFVWIELWHPIASQDESRRVVVMNPATGEYREIVVPTFPDAFLEDGGFVSLARDPAVGVQVIEKYVPDEASGPG